MIDTLKLKGIIVSQGKTQGEVAHNIGITQKTFGEKMKRGVFLSSEIENMISFLEIENPEEVFFAKNVTHRATKR